MRLDGSSTKDASSETLHDLPNRATIVGDWFPVSLPEGYNLVGRRFHEDGTHEQLHIVDGDPLNGGSYCRSGKIARYEWDGTRLRISYDKGADGQGCSFTVAGDEANVAVLQSHREVLVTPVGDEPAVEQK